MKPVYEKGLLAKPSHKRGKSLNEIILVGLDSHLRTTLTEEFQKHYFHVHHEYAFEKVIYKIRDQETSIIIFDEDLCPVRSSDFIEKCLKSLSHPSVIVLTKNKTVKNIQELFQKGAHDCLIKPIQISHLLHSVKRGLEKRKARIYGIKDPLTDLFNRYFFKEALNSEINRAQRYDRHLSLLMIDIDFFKRINDRFGHITGDRVLVELSQILKASFRQTDIITRFGGEEFAIILPETTIGHATTLAERIRKKIEQHDYSRLIGSASITVSIGISNYYTPEPKSETKLIHSADQALFAAKKEGRNKVCISVPKN